MNKAVRVGNNIAYIGPNAHEVRLELIRGHQKALKKWKG